MRNLIPTFILDQMAQGNRAGSLPAVVLFVDTSGFTPLTAALMQHGAEGAEIVAGVLDAVFTPLVEIIYARSGFIAGFAGDAFKAIFPTAAGDAHRRAIMAAWQIRQQMAQHPTHTTRFGVFAFEVKLCMADGEVEWGVWLGDDDGATQRAAYVFAGPALAACLEADPYAAAGEVVVTQAVYDRLRPWGIAGTPAAAYWRLTLLPGTWRPGPPVPAGAETARSEAVAAIFFPPDLLLLHTRGEFRQVVTVFINLQTLPTGADSFATALFRLLARDGGYLCRVGQIGDRDRGATLLLFWGAPISYEHDLVRALNFVVDLQAAAPTPFRAGITTNLVYAGFVGSALREEYTCYGSHVNLAARQMVMAEWGEVWLDDTTARLAGADFEIVPHARFRFKGFADERPVFRLIGRHATPQATFYSGAMIGRQHELAQLQAAVQPIVAGHFGGVVIITGEAGIGKSRLVHELQQSFAQSSPSDALDAGIRAQDAAGHPQWFLGQTDELVRQSLNPFRYWLRSYFSQSTTAGESANKRAFTTTLDELIAFLTTDHRLPTADRATRHQLADELDRTRSFLGALVDLHWPDSLYAHLEPQLRFENTLGALKTLILAESLRRPAILHLEDAHWLDADSRTLLARLTHRVDDFPFAVLITMRPPSETGQADAQAEPLLPSTVRQVTIPLAVLAPSELRTLSHDVLAGAVAPELVALVQGRSEGNPFFAEQMLRYLQEQGLLERGGAGWHLRTDLVESTILPGEARSVLIARLDRLTQAVKEVVQTAAVLGREFGVQVLSRMLHDPLSLPVDLQAAKDAAIWSALSQLRYLFKHALLRDAAYDMQLRGRLRALHQLAAESIQQLFAADLAPHYATLAYHTEQAGLFPEAARWYTLAGEQAAAEYANQSAIAHFSKALALTPESEAAARRDILLARVDVFNLLGDRNAEEHDLDMLQMLAQHMAAPSFQAQVAVRRMDYAWSTSNYAAVEALAPTAITLAQDAQDAQSEGRSHYIWGVSLRYQGVYDAARKQFEQARQIALATGNQRAEAYALLGLGSVAREQSAYSTAMSNYEQVLRIARETGEHRLEASILHGIALALSDQGRYAESEHVLKEGLRVARAIGDRHREGKHIDLLSDSALARRDVAQAEAHLNAALDILREVNDRDAEAWVFDNLGEISCYQGHHTQAMAYLEQSRSILLTTGQLVMASFPLCHLAAIVTALGDYGLARAQLDEALQLCRSIGHQWTEGEALVTLSVLCYAQGEDELAHHNADQAIAINQASRNRSEEMSARAYQGHILARMGHLDAAAASYQQVLERKQEWWGQGEPDIFSLTGFLHGLAGLAHLASLRQGWQEAYPYVEELLRDLADVPLDLRLNPQLIYLICYRVLRAAGDPRAQGILTTAYHRLQTQAANIADETLRRSFLENVAEHRELAAEFAQLG